MSTTARQFSGVSLQHGYRPTSETEALTYYNSHCCAACGAEIAFSCLPEAPQQQVGSIVFKIFPKVCHCGYINEVFVLLNNDRSYNTSVADADEAIACARQEGLLLDPFLEERLVAASVALHKGDLDGAAQINLELCDRFPQVGLPFYNLGVIYSQQQRYVESLAAYESALKINPQDFDALGNKAQVLMELNQLSEAGETYEQWRSHHREGTIVLAQEQGMFGTIRVIDTPEWRGLCIEEQLQGSVSKNPSAREWEPNCRFGPGPLSDDGYTAAFLLVGCQMPESSGLMLGLGCGAGLATSLACFPKLHLTVVEIDPTIVRLCLTFFPLIQHYVDTGRLTIIQDDAEAFLYTNRQPFDFIQCDVFQGDGQFLDLFTSRKSIAMIARSAPLLFVNIAGQVNTPPLHRILEAFDAVDRPLSYLYIAESIEQSKSQPINWFGLSQKAIVPSDFIPFPNVATDSAEKTRRRFSTLKNNCLSREHLSAYKAQFNVQL